jgi:L-asparaginase
MVRTDARSNVIHSALCAGMPIPEVCIFFGRHLFRGNRVTKTSIQSYDAMESPNMGALMEMGVEMEQRVWPLTPRVPFKLARGFERRVGAFQVVPGSGPELLDAAVAAGLQGVVLRGFGAGNLPQAGWPEGIDRAVRAGVAVVIQSQCLRGTVDLGRYKGGEAAMAAGAVPSGSLTSEATVVKLMYLLGQGHRGPVFRRQWQVDLAGEM